MIQEKSVKNQVKKDLKQKNRQDFKAKNVKKPSKRSKGSKKKEVVKYGIRVPDKPVIDGFRKYERLYFTQDYIPIKAVKDGIVETTDGRYIKILEIEPINFLLRSEEEQNDVILAFAKFLKVSPVRVQLKCMSRRADSEKHVRLVQKDLESENVSECLEISESYLGMVRRVGAMSAWTRRFFLIFEYESLRRSDDKSYDEIVYELRQTEHRARSYFLRCGNEILSPENEDKAVLDILYTYFNRNSCIDETISDRAARVEMDAMISRKKVVGVDPLPKIKAAHYFAPRGIDFTHPGYFIMDGLYYSILYVKRDGYPSHVIGGWSALLFQSAEGVDVDIYLRREDRAKTIDKVGLRIRLNRAKAKEMQDTASDYEEVNDAIRAGYYIKNGIARDMQDLVYLSSFITVHGRTLKELQERKQKVIDNMKANDFEVRACSFQMEDALKTVMPLCSPNEKLLAKAERNMLTVDAASSYIYTSFEMTDETGIMLGINRNNYSLCIIDLFNTAKNKNANMTILGTTGAGKTYALLLQSLRMRMRGIQCFLIAPTKGQEFFRACEGIGGQFIKIAPGSPHCINIMEIRHTISPEMMLIDGVDYNAFSSLLMAKIQQVETFYKLLIPDLSNVELRLLDNALINTYEQFGITEKNESIYEDEFSDPPRIKKMPIIGDLVKEMEKEPILERVVSISKLFTEGSARSFNNQTNVDLKNKYVVLDLSDLTSEMVPLGMMIALDYIWDVVKADRSKRKAIFIDEIWQLIGAKGNKQAAEFCLDIFKMIRGYGGAAIAATQDLSDFFSLEGGKYGKAIVNNSKNKILLQLEPDEAEYVKDVFKLTRGEIRTISSLERGQAIIYSNSSKIPVEIYASPKEHDLITTDPKELERIAKEKLLKQMKERANSDA